MRLERFLGKKADKLGDSEVVVLGGGSLGSFAYEMLSRSGVKVTVVDRDIVEKSNIGTGLFRREQVGIAKADVFDGRALDITDENIDELGKPDLIIDCTDNIETRYLLNEYCIDKGIRWIHSAVIKDHGSVKAFTGEECLSCLYPDSVSEETCETAGVMITAAAMVASVACDIAIRMLAGMEYPKELIRINKSSTEKIIVPRREGCDACNHVWHHLNGERITKTVRMCGKGLYQLRAGESAREHMLSQGAEKKGSVLVLESITLFPDRRMLVRAGSEQEARSRYSRIVPS